MSLLGRLRALHVMPGSLRSSHGRHRPALRDHELTDSASAETLPSAGHRGLGFAIGQPQQPATRPVQNSRTFRKKLCTERKCDPPGLTAARKPDSARAMAGA